MVDKDIREYTRMNRRSFLRSMSALGVTGESLRQLTKDRLKQLNTDLNNEVPRLGYYKHTNHDAVAKGEEAPKREPVYYSVSRDDWLVTEATSNAGDKISRQLPETPLISARIKNTTNGQHQELVVEVMYVEKRDKEGQIIEKPPIEIDQVNANVPNNVKGEAGRGTFRGEIEGIPVRLSNVEIKENDHTTDPSGGFDDYDRYCDYEYRPIPAGTVMAKHDGEGGTTGTPAYDSDLGDYVMVCSGHVVDSVGTKVDVVDDANGFYSLEPKGIVRDHMHLYWKDASTVNFNKEGDNDVEYDLAENSGDNSYRNRPIQGILSWTTIKDNVSNQAEMDFQGQTSGHVDTKAHAYHTNGDFFWLKAPSQFGDSGGPMYETYSSWYSTNTLIGGIIAGKSDASGTSDAVVPNPDGQQNCCGTYIGSIENDFGITV